MSHHSKMPPVPPASRSRKGVGGKLEIKKDKTPGKTVDNIAEQGETANIKQNTTNAGYFKGRRTK